jgi:hypothetical protein
MRVLVVQESMFGNTARVAYAIAHALADDVQVEVLHAADAPPDPGPDVDLIVVGAPTHAWSLPQAKTRAEAVRQGAPSDRARSGVREWLSALPAGRATSVAAFGTKVVSMRHAPGSAARAEARIARRRGFRVTAIADFFVSSTTGPLVDGELERAAAWARTLVPVRQPTP